ncbi:phage major capsid protein [Phascolarctobacterium faecium]|uniref:phage major capsid protein n=1 Tax=Phascolarctobacterium faecium TaxID=33025 RepID=UPI002666D352|nr:phage major capsid protein [Phascolarctobacterium faecium]
MRKSVEMKKQLDALKNEIKTLQAAGKVNEAHGKLDELNTMKNAVTVQEAIEQEEMENFAGNPLEHTVTVDNSVMKNRVFNKQILNMPLTEDEKKYATNAVGTPGQAGGIKSKGGYLLPEEQFNRLIEYRSGLIALKDLCEVIPVTRRSGSIPTTVEDDSELINFDELNDISKKDINFAQISYNVGTYGEIIPVANELLEDIDIDLISVIGRRFVRKGINTENSKIIALLQTLTPKAGDSYDDIKTALNVSLDPAISATAVIITNQNGFDYLDQVKLDNGLPLLQPVLTDPTKKQLSGRIIHVVKNERLSDVSGAHPFFVGDMAEFCKFFDREQVTVDLSTDAGFNMNAAMLRAIERFDVQKADVKAMVYLQITPA